MSKEELNRGTEGCGCILVFVMLGIVAVAAAGIWLFTR